MAKKSNRVTPVGMEEDWKTESDMRTLMEAEAIERDPKRLAKARALAQKKLIELASVAGKDTE